MSAITVNGDLIHYEVLGRGRPVILVHGLLGSWRYWVPTMQQLQLKYRVYALDLYGFGDSAKNPNKYSLEHQLALLEDFMQQLGLPKAALIGHGIGAIVATEFARRYPDRVPRMLVVSAPLFDPGDLERRTPAARKVLARTPQPAPAPAEAQPQEPVAVVTPSPIPEVMATSPTAPTVMSPSAAMRAALIEAARARKTATAPVSTPVPAPVEEAKALATAVADMTLKREDVVDVPTRNPLQMVLNNTTLDALLAKCFRRSEPSFEKLSVDVAKTDQRAPNGLISTFDSGSMLDTFQLLQMPVVIIHGTEDPIMPLPNEDVWNYITKDKENSVLPIPLPSVRHFPMLEDERFFRIVNEFLETPDISRIEVKERWRRRTR
jgi:pimeloyl-ACP methyl ester carboxylesterase